MRTRAPGGTPPDGTPESLGAVGNQRLRHLLRVGAIQARLRVSQPGDPAEQEADRVAERMLQTNPAPCACGTCASCAGANDRTIRRRAATTHAGANTPAVAGASIEPLGPGRPLDAASRAYFEPRFGHDFSAVRVHTGVRADAATSRIDALAFTLGRDVVFRSGHYAPSSPAGRRLLAHELVHVVQQSAPDGPSPQPIRRVRGPMVQRQQAPATPTPTPTVVHDTARDQRRWRTHVDRAVRAQFRLRGPGLTAGRVSFTDQPGFARQFPAASLEQHLLTLFLDFDPHGILHYNRGRLGVDPRLSTLRAFVQDGIRTGYFIGQTGEYDVTTGRPFPPQRFTPRELVAEFIAGITDIAGPRAGRHILIQAPSYVDTLVHETCHFYVHDRFRDMVNARTDQDDWIGNARIGQILFEGFAEYFAREVMSAHAADFGVLSGHAYQAEVEQVWRLVATLGEASVRQAYFHGDRTQLRRLAAAVNEYKRTNPDLLVPGFVVDQHLHHAPSARGASVPATS